MSAAPPPLAAAPWAVVPVKRFALGKSRLGAVLDEAGRAALARRMFDRVVGEAIGALLATFELAGCLVLTDDPEVSARARHHGAELLALPPVAPGRPLSALVDEALAHLHRQRAAAAALVVMGDLPHLGAPDLRALCAALDDQQIDLVLAPDERHAGTNALAVRLPAPLPTRFKGGDSLGDHLDEAAARSLRVALCQRPGLAFDLDTAADFARLSLS